MSQPKGAKPSQLHDSIQQKASDEVSLDPISDQRFAAACVKRKFGLPVTALVACQKFLTPPTLNDATIPKTFILGSETFHVMEVYEGTVSETGDVVTLTVYTSKPCGGFSLCGRSKLCDDNLPIVFLFQAVHRDSERRLRIRQVAARPGSMVKLFIHGEVMELPKLGDMGVLPLSWTEAVSWRLESAFDHDHAFLFAASSRRLEYRAHHGHCGDPFNLLGVATGERESHSVVNRRSIVTKNQQCVTLDLRKGSHEVSHVTASRDGRWQ